jgi:peptidoglycan/xylan/chitin deacetylase (PgdA/CDA1 family)
MPARHGRSVVLLYHSIGSRSAVSVPESRFATQMLTLRQIYKVVALEELVTRTTHGETGLAAVTFDDGNCDNYERAFPVLARLGLPFTTFVTTNLILRGRSYWSDDYADLPALTWGQLSEMKAYGATVGCHMHTHRQWTRQSSDEIRSELDLSKRLLEENVGSESSCFSYPFGQPHDVDRRGPALLSTAGFKFAFTTLHTSINRISNPFQIPRISINAEDSLDDFLQNITGQRDVLAVIERARSACWRAVSRECGIRAQGSYRQTEH